MRRRMAAPAAVAAAALTGTRRILPAMRQRARPVQAVSVDAMVDGVHFRLDLPRVTPADVQRNPLVLDAYLGA